MPHKSPPPPRSPNLRKQAESELAGQRLDRDQIAEQDVRQLLHDPAGFEHLAMACTRIGDSGAALFLP